MCKIASIHIHATKIQITFELHNRYCNITLNYFTKKSCSHSHERPQPIEFQSNVPYESNKFSICKYNKNQLVGQ